MGPRIMSSADVEASADIGDGTSVWHQAQIRDGAVVRSECVIGRGAYIGSGVRVGQRCENQNYALVYEPAESEAGVFIGPGVVLTNDTFPRAVNPDGSAKSAADWEVTGVLVGEGASVAVLTGEPGIVTMQEGLATVRVAAAVLESAALGTTVKI